MLSDAAFSDMDSDDVGYEYGSEDEEEVNEEEVGDEITMGISSML